MPTRSAGANERGLREPEVTPRRRGINVESMHATRTALLLAVPQCTRCSVQLMGCRICAMRSIITVRGIRYSRFWTGCSIHDVFYIGAQTRCNTGQAVWKIRRTPS